VGGLEPSRDNEEASRNPERSRSTAFCSFVFEHRYRDPYNYDGSLCEMALFWFSETRNRLLKYEATMAEAHYLIHHMMQVYLAYQLLKISLIEHRGIKQ
jgi:hypothetical protein